MPGFEGAFVSATEGRGRFLRPTSVRPGAQFRGQNIGIEVIGLREAAKIPEQLQRTYQRMLSRLRLTLQEAAREVVPGGASGRLGQQVHAMQIGSRVVVGTVNSEFARALNRGFTSTVEKGRALRFEDDGELFYRRRVRVAGRHFFEKWLALTPPIVEAVYESSFYNIKDLL